jgi:hypothetical protein
MSTIDWILLGVLLYLIIADLHGRRWMKIIGEHKKKWQIANPNEEGIDIPFRSVVYTSLMWLPNIFKAAWRGIKDLYEEMK